MINLNALLRRRVEDHPDPWAIEGYSRSTQSQLRSLFQVSTSEGADDAIAAREQRLGDRPL